MKNNKRKLASKMQTKEEKKAKGMAGSPFDSKEWRKRQDAIKKRVLKKVNKARENKLQRDAFKQKVAKENGVTFRRIRITNWKLKTYSIQ